ncbi:hypothetical protein ACTIVE_4206 [Actinomadura verrucosospora]|uniref:Uncharacterized protein n=1 Tax=Actinomadura verrucosospora TaxID=46165 RepID=A0A7D4A4W1_ACTVE|nr:hypothetical protein ACTIVE_4206 [Actinomadura verrucosospora]
MPAEPIKALAFNTLLSSQETDTHRAGPAFAFPAPGRLILTLSDPLGVSISGLFRLPFRSACASLPGGVAISSDPARFAKSGLTDAITARADTAKPRRLLSGGFPVGPAAFRRPAPLWGEVNSMPTDRRRQTGSRHPRGTVPTFPAPAASTERL